MAGLVRPCPSGAQGQASCPWHPRAGKLPMARERSRGRVRDWGTASLCREPPNFALATQPFSRPPGRRGRPCRTVKAPTARGLRLPPWTSDFRPPSTRATHAALPTPVGERLSFDGRYGSV
jgi:hypothetical protein